MSVAARLRKLEAQATPGPWFRGFPDSWKVMGASGTRLVAEAGGPAPDARPLVAEMDAAFIVRSRNLLPLLADLAEAMEEAGCQSKLSCANHPSRVAEAFELPHSLCWRCAALARVADQLDHEEGTT